MTETDIEKGDMIKIDKKKTAQVISVLSIHNIQVQFSNGEIHFYCLDKDCEQYDGANISIFKK